MAISARDSLTGTRLTFPVTPESVTFEQKLNYRDFELLSGAEARVPVGEKLRVLGFSGMLPGSARSGALFDAGISCADAQALLSQWLADGRRILVSVQGTPLCDLEMYLSSVSFTYKGGFGDVHYQLEFTQATSGTDSAHSSSDTADEWQLYTVRSGDTPWLVSMRCYGVGTLFSAIRDANPSLALPLSPGAEIKIPPRDWSA